MSSKNKIYLDYNLVAYYFDKSNIPLCEKIDLMKGYCDFPYSPAHLEEIAVPIMQNHKDKKPLDSVLTLGSEKLNSLSELTNNLALAPQREKCTTFIRENPIECIKRVMINYDLNENIEIMEEAFLQKCKDLDPTGKIANRISNLPINFLNETHYGKDLELKLHFDLLAAISARKARVTEFRWPYISTSHQLLERTLEMAFNFLEEIRYKPEKVSKSRSRMHDVTHAIYAASTDYLVSGDDRFLSKTKVVYKYFGIETNVISLDEFLNLKHPLPNMH
ncbi:hypothetical protein [Janthinobacterium sp. P210006]|uniref:hypothetical protein n=1 Tax=Janthinobacterium sp. P210006 TaxID=3112939 RepID=UPI002E25EE19|nr:hypothetical protein [Janthinobacterium sp. P210006]